MPGVLLAGSEIRADFRFAGGDVRSSNLDREVRVLIEAACEVATMLSVLRLVRILDWLSSGALDGAFGVSSSELSTTYSDASSWSLPALEPMSSVGSTLWCIMRLLLRNRAEAA